MRKSELIRRLEDVPGDPPVVDAAGNALAVAELSDMGEGDVVCLEFE